MTNLKEINKKADWSLLPTTPLNEVVHVLEHGKVQYGADNWKQDFVASVYWAALMRHSVAWWEGENIDKNSGRNHLAHIICNALFLLAHEQAGTMKDDRPTPLTQLKE